MEGWIKLGGGMRRWMLLKEMIELNLHLFSLIFEFIIARQSNGELLGKLLDLGCQDTRCEYAVREGQSFSRRSLRSASMALERYEAETR